MTRNSGETILPKIEAWAVKSANIQKRIRKFVEKWNHIATAAGYKVEVTYCMSGSDMPDGNQGVPACVFTKSSYLSAHIYFSLKEMEFLSDSEMEEVVVHELAHIILDQFERDSDFHKEQVTTNVARALLRAKIR